MSLCVRVSVDMSGFTPLSERLSHLGMRGVEDLSRHLNNYFGPITQLIERLDPNLHPSVRSLAIQLVVVPQLQCPCSTCAALF